MYIGKSSEITQVVVAEEVENTDIETENLEDNNRLDRIRQYTATAEVPKRYLEFSFNGDVISRGTWEEKDVHKIEEMTKLFGAEITLNREKLQVDVKYIDYSDMVAQNGMVEIDTENFMFHFSPDAIKKVPYFPKLAEDIILKYKEYFGDNLLKNKIDVWVYGDNSMEGGFYESGEDVIKMGLSGWLSEEGVPDFVLAHEIIHAVQSHQSATDFAHLDFVEWFREGQADYFAKIIVGLPQYSHEPRKVEGWTHKFYLREFRQRYGPHSYGGERDWSQYQKITDLNKNKDDYFAHHAAVNFFVETYGMDAYIQFSKYVGSGSSFAQAFKKAFDLTDEELMIGYKTFYNIMQ